MTVLIKNFKSNAARIFGTICLALSAVVGSNATAAWVKLSQGEGTVGYVDRTTIRKAGNTVKMWELLDLQAERVLPNGKPFMSAKIQREYDCKGERTRIIYYSAHSRNMGGGEVTASDANPAEWVPVAPDSGDEILWKYVCGKR